VDFFDILLVAPTPNIIIIAITTTIIAISVKTISLETIVHKSTALHPKDKSG
jgi:hypothetical protein